MKRRPGVLSVDRHDVHRPAAGALAESRGRAHRPVALRVSLARSERLSRRVQPWTRWAVHRPWHPASGISRHPRRRGPLESHEAMKEFLRVTVDPGSRRPGSQRGDCRRQSPRLVLAVIRSWPGIVRGGL